MKTGKKLGSSFSTPKAPKVSQSSAPAQTRAPKRPAPDADAFAPPAKKSRADAVSNTPGTYASGRKQYTEGKNNGTLSQAFEIDHQPARQVYTGADMTRKQSNKQGLVTPGPAFGVPESFHRQHITTGSSKLSDTFRDDQRKLLLSGPGGKPDSRTRLDVEQLSLAEYAHAPGFQKFATSGTADSKFMQSTFKQQGQATLPAIGADGKKVPVAFEDKHQKLRDLSFQAATTGKWPVAELEDLNKKLGK